jgi:hypothetical protein
MDAARVIQHVLDSHNTGPTNGCYLITRSTTDISGTNA